MNRRSFFKVSAATIGTIQVGLFASADATPEINTVLGGQFRQGTWGGA